MAPASKPDMGCDTALVWNAAKAELLSRLWGLRENISQIKASPDGKFRAVGACLGNVILWNLQDIQIVSILRAGAAD
ncbi:MAG: hypothetical protein EXR99_11545 [Gemmataceae bacterium]|nr:hypothetical protein [Gemmataceae bacterium]